MKFTIEQTAEFLKEADNIVILTHEYPDGDTLGSGFALCKILQQLGKKAKVRINQALQEKFYYLTYGLLEQDFTEQTVVSVDVADTVLLGELMPYKGKIDLCIDHHYSNTNYAQRTYVDSTAASTTEIVAKIGYLLGIVLNKDIADCIYTGITTDTGCFRYGNTTAQTHRIAAKMIENGCESAKINRAMFETVSYERMAIEGKVIESMELFSKGKIAVIYTTKEMLKQSGVAEDELEGISSLPRQIIGVSIGITLREKKEGLYKISLRTNDGVDAGAICAKFGGGGHAAAAGCSIQGTLEEAKEQIVKAAQEELMKQ